MGEASISGLPTVALATLGCKVNQAESEEIADSFAKAGFQRVEFGEKADVYVINTCTVTHIADRKSRQLVRQARCLNDRALVVATGCYAEVAPERIAELAHVDLVIGNGDKRRLVEAVLGACPDAQRAQALPPLRSRTRAFVKVQDGCDSFCTYCIVPHARGRQRSETPEKVVAVVRQRVGEGCREVVLTGVHVGAYGRDLAAASATRLPDPDPGKQWTAPAASGDPGEPEDLTPELLALWRAFPHRLCRHFHLPLQSGSDGVLRRMGRRYGAAAYRDLVRRVREAVPGAAITTDLMVGFPGETEDEFAESYRFVSGLGLAGAHVFRYSPRPGTAAARLAGRVAAPVAKQRSEEMLALATAMATRFRMAFVGQTLPVLYEEEVATPHGARWTGLTDNYIRVYVQSEEPLANQVRQTRLVGPALDGLAGL